MSDNDKIIHRIVGEPAQYEGDKAAYKHEAIMLRAELERLREPFRHADAEDWDYLERVLINLVRGPHDSQNRFWLEVVQALRPLLSPHKAEGAV